MATTYGGKRIAGSETIRLMNAINLLESAANGAQLFDFSGTDADTSDTFDRVAVEGGSMVYYEDVFYCFIREPLGSIPPTGSALRTVNKSDLSAINSSVISWNRDYDFGNPGGYVGQARSPDVRGNIICLIAAPTNIDLFSFSLSGAFIAHKFINTGGDEMLSTCTDGTSIFLLRKKTSGAFGYHGLWLEKFTTSLGDATTSIRLIPQDLDEPTVSRGVITYDPDSDEIILGAERASYHTPTYEFWGTYTTSLSVSRTFTTPYSIFHSQINTNATAFDPPEYTDAMQMAGSLINTVDGSLIANTAFTLLTHNVTLNVASDYYISEDWKRYYMRGLGSTIWHIAQNDLDITTGTLTTWYQYPTRGADTGKVSLGSYPDVDTTDLDGFRNHYFELRDMRASIEAVCTSYENPATAARYTTFSGTNNIWRVAIDPGQDGWTSGVSHQSRILAEHYNDIELVIQQLNKSELV